MTLDQCIEEVKKLERTDLNKAILAYLQELKTKKRLEESRLLAHRLHEAENIRAEYRD
jgi:hypothetical protein